MISEKDIQKLAKLAHLHISEEEARGFAVQIDSVLEYANKLSAVDTGEIEPMWNVHGLNNVFREDLTTSPLNADDALKNAPETSGRFIKVPLVIE